MTDIQFEFYNIQSHEHTSFKFRPGLNFILADDNNVGKSTIFKAIITMLKMPRVTNTDLEELLRGKTGRGYVSMCFAEIKVVFWMIRDTTRIRAFFEQHIEGSVVRLDSCPKCVMEALDIMMGTDNEPINFNNADSVQLIVEDTSKNDEVLSKVLIDLDVERVRKNSAILDRQVTEDLKVLRSKYADSSAILESLHYNDAVTAFFNEEDFLCACIRAVDIIEEYRVNFDVFSNDILSINPVDLTVCSILKLFSTINLDISSKSIDISDLNTVVTSYSVLWELVGVNWKTFKEDSSFPTTSVVNNMGTAIRVLDFLRRAKIATGYCVDFANKINTYRKECEGIVRQLKDHTSVVSCPVKGDVYFGEDKCIPVSDGSSF